MLAAVWHGPRDVRIEDIAEPNDPAPDELVLRVQACGICGTDLHEYLAGPIFIPSAEHAVVLGHELSGEVAAIGASVTNLEPGDRAVAVPHRPCGACHFCRLGNPQQCRSLEMTGLTRNGGFTTYVTLREDQAVRLPETVSSARAALVEPLAVTLHAWRMPQAVPGSSLAVIGAGPIGLSAVLTARASGIGPIAVVEPLPARRELAGKVGADEVIDPAEVDARAALLAWSGGIGADLSIECVGRGETMQLAIDVVRPEGLALLAGITEQPSAIDLGRVVADEIEVRGCIGYFDGEFGAAIELIAAGRLDPDPLVSGTIGVADVVEQGFERLVRERDACVKILVVP